MMKRSASRCPPLPFWARVPSRVLQSCPESFNEPVRVVEVRPCPTVYMPACRADRVLAALLPRERITWSFTGTSMLRVLAHPVELANQAILVDEIATANDGPIGAKNRSLRVHATNA